MKKLISLIMIAALALCVLAGCAKTTVDETVINIAALKGPTGMGIAPLTDKTAYPHYNISIESAPDVVTSAFIAGDIDVAAVPINVASVLYNKLEGDVVMLGVTTLGVLYVLEAGDTVQTISDLSGKTLYATGQGSTPEYIINYLLEQNGLTDSVSIEYTAEHSELASLLASGEVTLGMLPEPNVTATLAKNSSLRVALDLTEEWDKVCDTQLVQGCLIARESFVTEHKDAINTLISDYEAATKLVNTKHDVAAQLIVDNGILADVTLASNAISRCNIVFLASSEMKTAAAGMFEVLFASNPKSIGGALPADDLYYMG